MPDLRSQCATRSCKQNGPRNLVSLPATNLSPYLLSCAGRSCAAQTGGPNGSAMIRRSRRLQAPQILEERSLQSFLHARVVFSRFSAHLASWRHACGTAMRPSDVARGRGTAMRMAWRCGTAMMRHGDDAARRCGTAMWHQDAARRCGIAMWHDGDAARRCGTAMRPGNAAH